MTLKDAKDWIRENLKVETIEEDEFAVYTDGDKIEYHPISQLAERYQESINDPEKDPFDEAKATETGHERFFDQS